jgi:hypothetical protein
MSKSMCLYVCISPSHISLKYSLIAIKTSDARPCLQCEMVHFATRGFVSSKCQTTDGWIWLPLFLSILGIGYVHHKFVSTHRLHRKYDFTAGEMHMAIFLPSAITDDSRNTTWVQINMPLCLISIPNFMYLINCNTNTTHNSFQIQQWDRWWN